MKNIIFTIETLYSKEKYFLTVNEKQSIISQIDNALAEHCFCDDYGIMDWEEVTEEYTAERKALISEYESKYDSIEEAFCSGNMVTLEVLKSEMQWRESQ